MKTFILLLLYIPLCCFAQKIYRPVDTIIKRCPVIIEGRVVNVTPAYWNIQTKSSFGHEPYRSYIIQVYKVFKGNLTEKYVEVPNIGGQIDGMSVMVSDGVSLPDKGTTGIFYLSFPPDSDWSAQFYNSGDTLAKHHVLNIYSDPYNYEAMWTKPQPFLENVERNLYRHIEALTGIKRKVISQPLPEDTIVTSWLQKNHKQKLIGNNGLEFSFIKKRIDNKHTLIEFMVEAESTTLYSDVKQIQLVIKYDTATFGEYIVKNHILSWDINPQPNYVKLSKLPCALFDSAYSFDITDLDKSSFRINIKALDTSAGLLQIRKSILAAFHLKVLKTDGFLGLRYVEDKCNATYYNYESKKSEPYSYLYFKQDADIPMSYLYFPRISKVYPDTIHCGSGDTLNIRGEYFLSNETQVKLGYLETALKWTPYSIVPDSNIISISDTLIRLRVPCKIKAAWGSERYLPTESTFQLVKEVNQSYPTNGKIKYLIQDE